ncbi:hypothetical protein FBU30_005718 [Linnemannia zychae]|nr:hypothetical protein FBU30_005718 [Linnemannia zychae]
MQALQWMPAITHVTFKEMNEEIGSKLAMYCNQLEYIRQTSNNGMRNSHLLRILLRQCPNLTTIDAPCYFINQTSFTPRYLRSLSGADGGDDNRLNYDDQALYNKISAPRFTARLPRKRHLAVTLHYERLVAQETKIYTGLAQLTALRVLDIGYKYSPPEYIYDKQVYRWTLQLRLESGLGLLGALTQLEEFGFLGIDHRMEEAEIEWMAQAWPKLKVMHGLEYAQAFSAERWARLRKVMERLRPEDFAK